MRAQSLAPASLASRRSAVCRALSWRQGDFRLIGLDDTHMGSIGSLELPAILAEAWSPALWQGKKEAFLAD